MAETAKDVREFDDEWCLTSRDRGKIEKMYVRWDDDDDDGALKLRFGDARSIKRHHKRENV